MLLSIIAVTLSIIGYIIAVGTLLYAFKLKKEIKELKEDSKACLDDMNRQFNSTRKKVDEILIGNLNLGTVLNSLQTSVDSLADKQNDMQLQDPNSKLYVRAKKMIELGADIDEVVQECEIPKAEAEMLFRLQFKDKGNFSSEKQESSYDEDTLDNSNKINSNDLKSTKSYSKDLGNNLPKEALNMMAHFKK
ncbi:MAG: DUF2802 domain-containing protein [Succinivibrionaceae bacterium]